MPFYYWINRWKQRETFKLEISATLLLKAIFLMFLWKLCFSNPLGDHLTDQQMVAHIITSSSAKSAH